MPVLKFNQCDYDCHGKRIKRGFRVYCGKVDKTCSQGSPTPRAYGSQGSPTPKERPRKFTNGKVGVSLPVPSEVGLFPMPPLPPYDTRPKRFYRERKYIGATFRKEEHGEWIDSLTINKFQGRPYNVYNFKIIVEYNNDLWNHLIQRIKSEATVYNREAIIKDDYAYTAAKIISTPKERPQKFTKSVPISVAPTATPLTAVEQAVLSVLTNTPMHIDEITIASQLPPGKVSSSLLILELNDLIKRLPGAYFVRRT